MEAKSFEEIVEAKFAKEADTGEWLAIAALVLAFVGVAAGTVFFNSGGTIFFAFAVMPLFVFLVLANRNSLYKLEADRLKFAREARAEIAAEAKRAEEARKAGS